MNKLFAPQSLEELMGFCADRKIFIEASYLDFTDVPIGPVEDSYLEFLWEDVAGDPEYRVLIVAPVGETVTLSPTYISDVAVKFRLSEMEPLIQELYARA